MAIAYHVWIDKLMIPVKELCKRRNILSLEVSTPFLVPSFSSKGFPFLNKIWTQLRKQVIDVALISCYDLYYEHIETVINEPNILFLDSGGYEAKKDFDLSELYEFDYHPSGWTRNKHIEAVKKLTTYSSLVLVSYDEINNDIPLSKQINLAKEFFSHFPETSKCFLAKPFNSSVLNISDIEGCICKFLDFDIIGFTEKELGDSFLSRLDNLVKLRRILIENDLEIPIHIFGCLDPLSIWLFYLCGADIFDGLSWHRFAFYQNQAIYRNSWAILNAQVDLKDVDLVLLVKLENLRFLEAQRLQMIYFTRDYDLSRIPIEASQLQSILISVGVDPAREGGTHGW